jgi:hypothetical protein
MGAGQRLRITVGGDTDGATWSEESRGRGRTSVTDKELQRGVEVQEVLKAEQFLLVLEASCIQCVGEDKCMGDRRTRLIATEMRRE